MNKQFPFVLLILLAIIFGCDTTNNKKHITSDSNADSITIITNLLIDDSLNPQLFESRSKLYFQKGNIDPALRDLQSALELSPNNSGLFILLADIYFVLGQTDNSIASLKKSIRLDPDNEVPMLKLSETYLYLNEPVTAIRYADEAISIDRQNPESYYVKAMGLMENRDTSAAINNLRISANLDTNNYMAYIQLGSIYTAANDTMSSIYYSKALKVRPDDERALYYLGMYYQEHKMFEDAIEKFTRIVELYPGNQRAYYNMGYIYLVEKEDYENAKIMFQDAISANPQFVAAVYNLGRTMEAMGDYNNAREQYKKSLEILPNYPLAVQGMNRLDDIMIRQN